MGSDVKNGPPKPSSIPKHIHADSAVRCGKWAALLNDANLFMDLLEHGTFGIVVRDITLSTIVLLLIVVAGGLKESELGNIRLPIIVHSKESDPALGSPSLAEYKAFEAKVAADESLNGLECTCLSPQVFTKVTLL